MEDQDKVLGKLTAALTHLSRAYLSTCDKMLSNLGVTQAVAWPALMISRMGDGVRPGAVAEALNMEPSSVVRVIEQLIKADLIERHEDATDRRARILCLTEKGRKLVAEIEKILIPFRRELFKTIKKEDLETFVTVVDTLRASIERYQKINAD